MNKLHTGELLRSHLASYPKAEIEDVFKYLFHSALGCEHLVASEERALGYIKNEYKSISSMSQPCVEALDGEYSRVHLSCLDGTLAPETLARLFCLSAKKEERGIEELEEKLAVARELVARGDLPFGEKDFCKKLDEWREAGYPALHHSDTFREEYRPAYRVISNRYAKFLPLFSRIDALRNSGGASVVAIEGGSASGKSTLGEILREVYDCNLFHTDDFFLRPEQRTPQRLAEIGGNIDRERFCDEVADRLLRNEKVVYRPFNCSLQALGEEISVEPKPLSIVEGVYSMHPAFSRYYDLAVFLEIDAEYQKKRILARNSPTFAKRFFEEWIPLEERYFVGTDIRARADMIIEIG